MAYDYGPVLERCYASKVFPADTLQDVGGQDKIRPLWRHYYTGTQVSSGTCPAHCHHLVQQAHAPLPCYIPAVLPGSLHRRAEPEAS